MTKQSFKIGDTVTLTSGGHLMTVISIEPEDVITCAWPVRESGAAARLMHVVCFPGMSHVDT